VARILAFVLGTCLLALPALAQVGDAAYCTQLGDLARRYTGSAGGEGRLSPDLSTLGAASTRSRSLLQLAPHASGGPMEASVEEIFSSSGACL